MNNDMKFFIFYTSAFLSLWFRSCDSFAASISPGISEGLSSFVCNQRQWNTGAPYVLPRHLRSLVVIHGSFVEIEIPINIVTDPALGGETFLKLAPTSFGLAVFSYEVIWPDNNPVIFQEHSRAFADSSRMEVDLDAVNCSKSRVISSQASRTKQLASLARSVHEEEAALHEPNEDSKLLVRDFDALVPYTFVLLPKSDRMYEVVFRDDRSPTGREYTDSSNYPIMPVNADEYRGRLLSGPVIAVPY